MSTEQEQGSPGEGDATADGPQLQQQQQPPSEGHAGHGSDSAMKHMRIWEQRRASNSVGKGRQGPT